MPKNAPFSSSISTMRGKGSHVPQKKTKKPINLTCKTCRRRKIRCDGALPACGICLAYGDECQYDKPPSLAQIMAMEGEIEMLKRQNKDLINDLNRHLNPERTKVTGISTTSDEFLQDLLQSSNVEGDNNSLLSSDRNRISSSIDSMSWDTRFDSAEITPPWKDFAIKSCSLYIQLPIETVKHLFNTHWTWVHHTFMFIPESMFIQDVISGGEYFSPLLLHTICLHSTRFSENHLKEELKLRAKMMVGQELQKKPNIAFLQSLLQLSAHEFGSGNDSLAWMYSGMAYRLAIELGLSADIKITSGNRLEMKRIKIRQQLSWSCYLWDKIMSLYLGRMPTQFDIPSNEPDFSCLEEKDELWPPFGCEIKIKDSSFKNVPSLRVACFQNFCKLAKIINDVLVNIYGNKVDTVNVSSFLFETQIRLERWRSESRLELKIEDDAKVCPPPHVVVQNMLYQTTIILLHRPFRAIQSSRIACKEASIRTEQYLLLFEKTFGLDKGTYAMAYSIYIAATVAVQESVVQTFGASDRIQTFLRALESIRVSCPGIQRSIDMILKHSPSSNDTMMANRHQRTTAAAGAAAGAAATDIISTTTSTKDVFDNSNATSVVPINNNFDQLPPFPLANTFYSTFPSSSSNETGTNESEFIANPFIYLNSFPNDWGDLLDHV